MPRYRLHLEYDGGPFQGWQRQPGRPTVQATLEAALLALTGETVEVTGAGRTDAGVHARGQVAHLDLAGPFPLEKLAGGLNAHLRPQPVVVLAAGLAGDSFHARFSAVRRAYRYVILCRRTSPVLEAGRVWHVPVPLDAEAMHEAGRALVGRHDFTSFRSSACQAASPVKTLAHLHVERRVEAGCERIELVIEARSFLHHQVRNIAGTLKLVGEGKAPVTWPAAALAARDRAAAGPTAPPHGLYLERVDFPD